MTIRRELIDELLKEYETPKDILGEDGLLKQLTKAVIERCLGNRTRHAFGVSKACTQGQYHRPYAQWAS